MRFTTMGRALALAGALAAAVPALAAAEVFRDIASVTVTTFFDGSWRVETTDVFLARIIPNLTAQARITRLDSPGWFQHTFFLGPVASFTDTIYAGAVYGLGMDSAGLFTHEVNVDVNYETASTATSLGLKADWFPGSGYSYYLPSVSGKFHPLPALGLFGKFFLSIDSAGVVTESFWGEADYAFSPLFRARAGFTFSRAAAFGYSVIAGIDLSFSAAFALKYSLQYLSDSVEYLAAPQPRSGIVNALIIDVRF
jgi:hypothetical protein